MSSGSGGTFVSRKVVGHDLLHADSVFVIELRPLCMFHVMIGHLFQDGDNFDLREFLTTYVRHVHPALQGFSLVLSLSG